MSEPKLSNASLLLLSVVVYLKNIDCCSLPQSIKIALQQLIFLSKGIALILLAKPSHASSSFLQAKINKEKQKCAASSSAGTSTPNLTIILHFLILLINKYANRFVNLIVDWFVNLLVNHFVNLNLKSIFHSDYLV